MSNTSRKNRKKAGLNPTSKTAKLLFDYQSHLFTQSQKINKSEASEYIKQNELNDILKKMQVVSKQLIKRGYQTQSNYEATQKKN